MERATVLLRTAKYWRVGQVPPPCGSRGAGEREGLDTASSSCRGERAGLLGSLFPQAPRGHS